MKFELTIAELGSALKNIEDKYGLNILVKLNLSGGWMTITGEANIIKVPSDSANCGGKDNIIHIMVKNENSNEGTELKVTGAKNKKFNVDIASTRYKEIKRNSLTINQIKVNENESKLRIDEDIIFTIKATSDEIEMLIEDRN